MKTNLEPPPELAPHDVVTTEEPLLELPPEPPPEPPREVEQPQPKPPEGFLRRS
jgi:hypothetical protein